MRGQRLARRQLDRFAVLALAAVGAFGMLAAPAAAAEGPRPSGSAREAELLQLEQGWVDAVARRDAPAIERLLADDFTDTAYDGSRRDKAQMLARLKTGGPARLQRLTAMMARLFGGSGGEVGVVTGTNEVTADGATVHIRFLDVFVRRDGRWQAVAAHETLVRPR